MSDTARSGRMLEFILNLFKPYVLRQNFGNLPEINIGIYIKLMTCKSC